MTNTTEIELDLCGDCILVIANDDDSGAEDADGVRDGLARLWGNAGWRLVVLTASDDVNGIGSMSGDECDGCGREETLRGTGVAVREF